jgi:acetylornithine deacetylase
MELPIDAKLGPSTLNIGLIKGGVATNVIAPAAEAELLFRIVTNADVVKRSFEATVNGRAEIEYSFACDAVFMQSLDGFETEVVAFTTDIPLLNNWGTPLLFGPGSILDAHTANEKISKSELLQALDVYAKMVTTLKARLQKN